MGLIGWELIWVVFLLSFLFSSDFFFGDGGQKFSGTEMIQCCDNNEQMDKVKVAETLWLRCSSFLSSHSTICRAETNKSEPDGDEKTIPKNKFIFNKTMKSQIVGLEIQNQ